MSEAKLWSVSDVGYWLEENGLEHLKKQLASNQVDGAVLLGLTKADLREELQITALKDRKDLWEKLESLQQAKPGRAKQQPRPSSPPPKNAGKAAPVRSPPARPDRRASSPRPDVKLCPPEMMSTQSCDYCFKVFTPARPPLELTLPGEKKPAVLHEDCKEAWVRENAKKCQYCNGLMATGVITVTLPGAAAGVELHEGCRDRWIEENAKKCDHCQKPLVNEMVNLTGWFGQASVHEACCDAFEKALKNRPRAATQPVTKPVALSPPRTATHATREGVKCAECQRVTKEPIVSLTGHWGLAQVHAKCVDAFEKKRRRSDPGVGAGGGGRCEHCMQRFIKGHDIPVMLTLPGSTKMVEMHTSCKEKYLRAHGPKCDECGRPITQDVTTLTGAFGQAKLHPKCVPDYEKRIKLLGGKKPPSRATPSATPRKCI